MTITAPDNYSSVNKPVVFHIEKDTPEIINIIIDNYIKQMNGTSIDVNVADYFKHKFIFSPTVIIGHYTGTQTGRVVVASISVNDTVSNSVALLQSTDAIPFNRFLTNQKKQYAKEGEILEVTAISDSGYEIIISPDSAGDIVGFSGNFVNGGYGVLTFPALSEKFYAIIKANDSIIDIIEYENINYPCGYRLAWINRYGSIDSYYFRHCQEESFSVTKDKIYSADGYMITSVKGERKLTVSTNKITQQTAQALSDILSSQRLFIYDNGYREVDLITNSVKIYDADTLVNFQFSIQPKQRAI
ncbi:MAG: hypothetical protein LBJ63_10835 [Prevotellaceae bacterium]|jgi:hypothetical protein|nr:hypothetical protein [Prevotellaceae bacterium]